MPYVGLHESLVEFVLLFFLHVLLKVLKLLHGMPDVDSVPSNFMKSGGARRPKNSLPIHISLAAAKASAWHSAADVMMGSGSPVMHLVHL